MGGVVVTIVAKVEMRSLGPRLTAQKFSGGLDPDLGAPNHGPTFFNHWHSPLVILG